MELQPWYSRGGILDLLFHPKETTFTLAQLHEMLDAAGLEARKDVAWKYGVDEDVYDADVRQCEVRNWLKYLASLK